MIRSWVLGNEAHENRNGVLLFIFVCEKKYGGLIFYRKEAIRCANYIISVLKASVGALDDTRIKTDRLRLKVEKDWVLMITIEIIILIL